ncbi:MAG TPA: hypothetical protein VK324_04810, partial [Tepidisphaeraceae bacterium]|nr:hypothetical protein [Tepidisphaeraceae bacterium]
AAMSPLRDDFYEWLDQTTAAYGRRGWPRYELHEVVVPMLALLAKETIGDKDIVLPNPVAGGERTVGGKTSTALHERHPIVECNPYYIMVEAVFEWMRPHVCVDECFTVVPIEI